VPTISDSEGNKIVISGRSGIEFSTIQGYVYLIDSEMVISEEYNIAIYADNIEVLGGNSQLDEGQAERLIETVVLLCTQGGIRTKVFW